MLSFHLKSEQWSVLLNAVKTKIIIVRLYALKNTAKITIYYGGGKVFSWLKLKHVPSSKLKMSLVSFQALF